MFSIVTAPPPLFDQYVLTGKMFVICCIPSAFPTILHISSAAAVATVAPVLQVQCNNFFLLGHGSMNRADFYLDSLLHKSHFSLAITLYK